MSASINWREHIEVLHRLTGHNVFMFRYFGEGYTRDLVVELAHESSCYFDGYSAGRNTINPSLARLRSLEMVSSS